MEEIKLDDVHKKIEEILSLKRSINLLNLSYEEDEVLEFINEDEELLEKDIEYFVEVATEEYKQYDLKEIIEEFENDDISMLEVEYGKYIPVTKLFVNITCSDFTIFDYATENIMKNENLKSQSEITNAINELAKKANSDVEKINKILDEYQNFEFDITDLIIENMKG